MYLIERRYYHNDGSLNTHYFVDKNYCLEGIYKRYFQNGILLRSSYYIKNKMYGITQNYNCDCSKLRIDTCKQNIRHGILVYFHHYE